MPRVVSSIGKLFLFSKEITPENIGDHLERITSYINSLVDILSRAPADAVEDGVINSQAIIQNSIDKKHVLATNSSNLLDNPSFESVGLKSTYEIVNENGTWDRIDPTDTSTIGVIGSVDPYQGKYVARYRTEGQDGVASVIGSGDMGNVGKYNAGVIQAQEGEEYAFSFKALRYAGTAPAADDNIHAVIQFRNKSGGVEATHVTSPDIGSADVWTSYELEQKVAPADTAYITVGIQIDAPGSPESVTYYFDGTILERRTKTSTEYSTAYFTGKSTLPAFAAYTDTGGTDNWYNITKYSARYTSGVWAEVGNSGEIEFVGTNSGLYKFDYGGSFAAQAYLSLFYFRMRIQYTSNDGVTWTEFTEGGDIEDNVYGNTISAGVYYVRYPHMSGSILKFFHVGGLSYSPGDTRVRLQYSMAPITALPITTAHGFAAGQGAYLVITPVAYPIRSD